MPTTIKVSRADVYAARARVELDKRSGKESDKLVRQLAETKLGSASRG